MGCKYCDIVKKNSPSYLILETKHWRVILSYSHGYLGRCIIILKKHCGELSGLTKEEWNDFGEVATKMEDALKKAFGAVMFNWTSMMNDAYISNYFPFA